MHVSTCYIWNLKNPINLLFSQNLQIPVIRSLWQHRNEGDIKTGLRSRPERISNSQRSFPPLRRPDRETPTLRLSTFLNTETSSVSKVKYFSFCLLGKGKRASIGQRGREWVKYATSNWHHHKMMITKRKISFNDQKLFKAVKCFADNNNNTTSTSG